MRIPVLQIVSDREMVMVVIIIRLSGVASINFCRGMALADAASPERLR
jgi:hypothetical protein